MTMFTLFMLVLPLMPAADRDTASVAEPPIPVYMVCPYHEDSLRLANGGMLPEQYRPTGTAAEEKHLMEAMQRLDMAGESASTWQIVGFSTLAILNLLLLGAVRKLTVVIRLMKLTVPALAPPLTTAETEAILPEPKAQPKRRAPRPVTRTPRQRKP